MSVIGASSGGTVTNLIALGAMDVHLTYCPGITFWRFRYNKYTNFTLESIEQPFNSPVSFGADVSLTVNRNGDLIYFTYVVVDLPGICACVGANNACGYGSHTFPACDPCDPCGDGELPNPCAPAGTVPDVPPTRPDDYGETGVDECTGVDFPYAHWINAIGQFIVKRASLVIGGIPIDTLYNDYLFMWEELSGKPGKRLTEMVGKRFTRAQLIDDSRFARRLYVPLPFSYTQCSGNALSLASLQFHGVSIMIKFEDLQRCIQVSSSNVVVVRSDNRQPINQNDLQARLDITYVYLDVEERDAFTNGCFTQLITQVQKAEKMQKGSQMTFNLNFNHPMIELIWAIRRRKNELCNNHFNYSGKWGLDPIETVDLRLNNSHRFSTREGKYFRMVTPYQHHTNIPDAYVYCYPFSLHPEDPQPSGSCNFSRIDNIELTFNLQPQLADEDVTGIVFGKNYNVLKYKKGIGGIEYQ